MLTLQAIQITRPTSTLRQQHAKPTGSIMTSKRQCHVLAVDSLLRSLGFYGYLVFDSRQESWILRVCVGYRPPLWLNIWTSWSVSCGAELTNSTISPSEFGFSITSGYVRVQNRVSIDSPFMRACRLGDVGLIIQSLTNGSGRLADRTTCTGKTPLLVSSTLSGYRDAGS
jgi:hypothetical protein